MEQLDQVRINFDTGELWLLNLALSLVMFGVALNIRSSDFRMLWQQPKPVLVGLLSQFLLLPFLTCMLVLILGPAPSLAMGMFMVAACPGGNVSNFMSQLSGGNAALSVCLTAIATLLAIVLTPLNLQLWASFYEPSREILREVAIAPADMVQLVLLILGVPLFLGMLLRKRKPRLADRLTPYFRYGSLLFFLLLVVLAISKNSDLFRTHLDQVYGLVLGHNLLAFSLGAVVALVFRLKGPELRSITIETGIQNSGLGLLLVFTFFDGLGGMALLTAFWGIWHLISGMLLAGSLAYFFPISKNNQS